MKRYLSPLLLLALLPWAAPSGEDAPADAERLRAIQQEMSRLSTELERLAGREIGLLGELERLDGELLLREAEYEEATLRGKQVAESITEHDRTLAVLETSQHERRDYLKLRLRAIYKSGPDQVFRQFIEDRAIDDYWSGVSYAALLSERDGSVLRAYRLDAGQMLAEREELQRAQRDLQVVQADAGSRQAALAAARRERQSALQRARADQSVHRAALAELRSAAAGLTQLVDSLPPAEAVPVLDIRKFKGLLEWPTEGKVSAGFGTRVDPRFGTEVPHPGWDIAAQRGTDIVAIFDGDVVLASWMRGYGLTIIVDHGNNVVSIYAHASALVVHEGEKVERGQLIGQVGDTGSLRGELLYFELRVEGRPTDPRSWLRPR